MNGLVMRGGMRMRMCLYVCLCLCLCLCARKSPTLHTKSLVIAGVVVKGRATEVFENLCSVVQPPRCHEPVHVLENECILLRSRCRRTRGLHTDLSSRSRFDAELWGKFDRIIMMLRETTTLLPEAQNRIFSVVTQFLLGKQQVTE